MYMAEAAILVRKAVAYWIGSSLLDNVIDHGLRLENRAQAPCMFHDDAEVRILDFRLEGSVLGPAHQTLRAGTSVAVARRWVSQVSCQSIDSTIQAMLKDKLHDGYQ